MKPTIAAVQGGCIGGGQRMVWPCDLVFCTEDAFFMDPTATMGIGGIQSHLHTWFYGPRLAKEMIYSGMRLPAQRLYAMGQVNRLYPDLDTLHAETLAFAHDVATEGPRAPAAGEARRQHHDGHHGPALRGQPDGRAARRNAADEPEAPRRRLTTAGGLLARKRGGFADAREELEERAEADAVAVSASTPSRISCSTFWVCGNVPSMCG